MKHPTSLGPILAVLALVLLIFLGVSASHLIGWIIINSIVGLILLILVNFIPSINISINIWTILIVALGGFAGLLLLVLLELVGVDV